MSAESLSKINRLNEMASHYYAVARDLEWRGSQMLDMGRNLFEIAGHLSQQAIAQAAGTPEIQPNACQHDENMPGCSVKLDGQCGACGKQVFILGT